LGKCVGISAVLATVASLVIGMFVLTGAKIGSGIGKIYPLMLIAGWIGCFVPSFTLTSLSLYLRARLKDAPPAQVRELGFATGLSLFALVVLFAALITRLT